MPALTNNLVLDRCPHCSVASPNLEKKHEFETHDHAGKTRRFWRLYICRRCGGAVTAFATDGFDQFVRGIYPEPTGVDELLPDKVRQLLQQASDSLHAPAGAVMLAASAVDSMLKLSGYKDGSLYSRIDQAKTDAVITASMAAWAHDVRLDANDQRHADENAALPEVADAQRAVDFAIALGDFLFVLPARVKRGLGN